MSSTSPIVLQEERLLETINVAFGSTHTFWVTAREKPAFDCWVEVSDPNYELAHYRPGSALQVTVTFLKVGRHRARTVVLDNDLGWCESPAVEVFVQAPPPEVFDPLPSVPST